MVQLKAKVIQNTRVKSNYFHLSVEAPEIARAALPGQFVMVRVGEGLQPLLRRPFSIHKIGYRDTVSGVRPETGNGKRETVEILYEVVGQGTEILSAKRSGTSLDMIGPLGNGFDFGIAGTGNRTPILIAGGMGAAPLLFLAEKIREKIFFGANSPAERKRSKIKVLIGARTGEHILCEKEFKKCGCDVTIATDDGSRGFKGRVTDLFTSRLSSVNGEHPALAEGPVPPFGVPLTIYACGPKPMLQVMSGIAKKYALAAQLSLESHMACGIGACLGCVINTQAGYKRVCKEGPVFGALDILW
ncbi:MAG: dihydroorotate dehydrogenase electron transfer subunit [Candidatus Omnitrophota bacterium]|jgi:dihydroorotate dehydrogenase electron transfer subunit